MGLGERRFSPFPQKHLTLRLCSLSLSCPVELQTPKIERLVDSDILLRSLQLRG